MPNKEPLFRFVLNHSQELIIRYDSYGFINYVNQKAMDTLGYTGEELQGLYIGELLKGVYCMVDNHVAFADQYRDKEEIETVIYRKNQTCFPVVMTSTSIIYEGEVAFFCMLMDMTNYKESIRKLEEKTEQVKQSIQERDSFVANVTHELRTPVNGIKGNTELMMEQENDLKKLAFLKIILDSCNTMEGIINNILDFAKLEAGKFQLEEKPFSFREFMHRMEKQFQAMTMRKGLRLTMSIAQNIPDNLVGDELRLTQILNNLVSNAVKFTVQGYVGIEVTLNCQIQDEVELFFVVADTGIGISKDLIGMMHGDIWAEGEKDKGTTFSFTVHLKLQDTEQTQEDEITQIQAKGITVHNRVPIEKNQVYEFKTAFNEKELRRNFEKLNLSADMENWYKAENYAAMIKQLLQGSSKELQRAAFKMEMAVRKADYEKFRGCADVVKDMLFREWNQEEENG